MANRFVSSCMALLFAASCLLAFGCAGPSRLQTDYGTSYKLALMDQTLNPDAWKNLSPVEGIDGRAAEKIVEKYEKSFEKTSREQKPVYMFGIGASGGGAGTSY